jgi:tryptophanyl-tRNA synthetase
MLYQAHRVPVGEDQRQHIELTRDLGQRFNSRYGETFVIPEAHIMKSAAKINDLQDPTAKMSKSAASNAGVIDILDSTDINVKKIKSAVTDTGKEVKFDEKNKPGISNLLSIHSALSGRTIAELENDFAGKGYGDFKGAVADVVTSYFAPVREKTHELLADESALLKILNQGSLKARTVASVTLQKAYSALGLVPNSNFPNSN